MEMKMYKIEMEIKGNPAWDAKQHVAHAVLLANGGFKAGTDLKKLPDASQVIEQYCGDGYKDVLNKFEFKWVEVNPKPVSGQTMATLVPVDDEMKPLSKTPRAGNGKFVKKKANK